MKTLKIILYLNLILIVLCISSCGDEPVTPSEGFDAPRFSWTSDTIVADVVDIWAYDTNHVFFTQRFGNLVQYDGQNYHYFNYGGDIFASCISGYDYNNVYIGGYNPQSSRLMLKKWNGTGFENIFVSDTNFHSTIITNIKVISPINIWLSTSNGRVYHFDGNTFTAYYFNNSALLQPILEDQLGNIYVAGYIHYPYFPSFDSLLLFVNKYEKNAWITIFEEMYHVGDEGINSIFGNVGHEMVGIQKHGVLKYNGSSFQKILNVEQIQLLATFYGNSTRDILCLGTKDLLNKEIYHWNGAKWSAEFSVAELFPQRAFCVNGTYFVTYFDFDRFRSIIYKGKTKH